MSDKSYFAMSAAVFTVVGISHLVRAVMGIAIRVDGAEFPIWASWCAVVILAFLAISGFRRTVR
jgi:hypothetical protein